MKITLEKNPIIIQSDIKTLLVKITKSEDARAKFKVKAVGTSAGLEHRYKNRAVMGETGDFYYEEEIVIMEEGVNEHYIEIKIFETERTKEPKYFSIKLINLEDEEHEFSPNAICHCYIVENLRTYLLLNVDRYNLPMTKVVNHIITKKIINEGKENTEGNDEGGNKGNVSKVDLKMRTLIKTNSYAENDDLIFSMFHERVGLYDLRNLFEGEKNNLYKVLILEQYTPSVDYEINYQIDMATSTDILAHLLDIDILSMIKSTLTEYVEYNSGDHYLVQQTIGYAKKQGKTIKIPKDETIGKFTIRPTPSRRVLTFSSRNRDNEPDGVCFSYNKSENKVIFRSF